MTANQEPLVMTEAPEYPKLQSVFKRDPETSYKTLLEGVYSTPELEALGTSPVFRFEEKTDGTNIRVLINKHGARFLGRTNKSDIPGHLRNTLETLFSGDRLAGLQEAFPLGVVLYGEGYGKKIQSNGHMYRSQDQGFMLFDAITVDKGTGALNWLTREDLESVAAIHGIEVAPIIGRGTLRLAVDIVREKTLQSQVAEQAMLAEGLVMKTDPLLLDKRGTPIVTKIKHGDFQ